MAEKERPGTRRTPADGDGAGDEDEAGAWDRDAGPEPAGEGVLVFSLDWDIGGPGSYVATKAVSRTVWVRPYFVLDRSNPCRVDRREDVDRSGSTDDG